MHTSVGYEKGAHRSLRKTIVLALIVAGLLVAALARIFSASAGGLRLLRFWAAPAQPQVSIQGPLHVTAGSEFQWLVSVFNSGEEPLVVEALRLPHGLLEAVTLLGVSPNASLPASDAEWVRLPVHLSLPPGESREIVLEMVARSALDLSARMEVIAGGQAFQAGIHLLIQVPTPTSTPSPVPTFTPTPTATATPLPSPGLPVHSVVKITGQELVAGSLENDQYGSGSILTSGGLILTNAHIILNDDGEVYDSLLISLTERSEQPPRPAYYAEVAALDEGMDIAIVRITTDVDGNPVDPRSLDLPAVELGDSDELELGDAITILGYPGIGGGTITLTRGEVSGFTGSQEYGDRAYIKTSATTAGGNSGGLALDESGRLIGVPTRTGYGGTDNYVDCRRLADTNGDGQVNRHDTCVPTGGFINALRPVNLVRGLIAQALEMESQALAGGEQAQP